VVNIVYSEEMDKGVAIKLENGVILKGTKETKGK